MGNQHGKHHGQYGRYVDWENAERPSPPGKPYLAPDGADQQDIIKIRWAKPMYDGGAPIIGYVVEHRRTGSPHWLRASPHLAPDEELILTGLEPGWRYQFRVSAENDIGRSDPGDLSEPLTITVLHSAASAPHFNRELRDTIALENETVELIVHVIATPAPKISWYKDGFELFSSRRTKIVTEGETSTLIIYQAALEDEGEIKCTATNRAGHVVTKGYLKLEAPPRIRLPRQYEEGLIFEKGETIRLKVSTAGRPLPSVTWWHNGERVLSEGRHEVTDNERGSMLRILDACRQDRGEYMVKGINKIGDDAVSFLVTITDRPSVPGRPQVVMTLGRTTTLRWTSPDDDGGCKVGAYIVEYYRVGWDMWLKAATSRQLSAVLVDLIEGSEYKFRVKAENPYGLSEPSEESDTIFIPDAKRGILKPEPKPPNDFDSALLEERKKRGILKHTEVEKRQASPEPQTEAAKRRRILEENARKLLDTPGNYQEDQSTPSDISEKRRLLEENARKLLDTPLSTLLSEGPPKLHTIEKPPRKRRSPSVSPGRDRDQSSPPPVPKRRNKMKSQDQASPLPARDDTRSMASPELWRDDSITHGSSELVLLLVPEERPRAKSELSAKARSEIELSLAEPGVAPPLSLSAPELGSDEPFEMPMLREAVSSSELLHERAMARMYQDAAEEEQRKVQMRRKSLERRSSFREAELERRHSLREAERKHSFKEASILEKPFFSATKIKDAAKAMSPEPASTPKETPAQPSKISAVSGKSRLSSVEREQMEFAKVRERLRLKNSEKQASMSPILPPRPPNLKQLGSMSSQMSSFEGETRSEQFEEEDMSVEEEEEMLDEEEEDYLDEEMEEEEDVENEEESMDDFIQDIKLSPKPPVPPHGLPGKAENKHKEAPKPVEEETYHPRSMVPTKGMVQALPAQIEKERTPPVKMEIPEITFNDETIQSRNEQTIIEKEEPKTTEMELKNNVAPKQIKTTEVKENVKQELFENDNSKDNKNIETKIPEVKKKKSRLLSKIGFGLKRQSKKASAVETLITDATEPVISVVLPKPILKKRKKEKGKKDQEDDSVSIDSKKKQVRIAEPGEESNPKNKLQRRQQSLEEEEEANKVLICHYSDIVREFGAPKKVQPKMYLDYEELEAHAPDLTIPEIEKTDADEVMTMISDQEERGSAPDLAEVESLAEMANEGDNQDLSRTPSLQGSVPPSLQGSVPPSLQGSVAPSLQGSPPPSLQGSPPPSVEGSRTASRQPSTERTHSPSPQVSPQKPLTPEERARSTVEYMTDVAIIIFAFWLYLFKNPLYVIPVLVLLVYRQLQDSIGEKYNSMKETIASKIPARVRSKIRGDSETDKESPED